MQPRAKTLLWDVAQACDDIFRVTSELGFEDYVAQQDVRRLAERYLEIVGEALRRLEHADEETSNLIPSLRQWVNLRNAIAHGYDTVDEKTIWGICRSSTPLLREHVMSLLEDSSGR
jgi:uncharacterized protein with HEPN domain